MGRYISISDCDPSCNCKPGLIEAAKTTFKKNPVLTIGAAILGIYLIRK